MANEVIDSINVKAENGEYEEHPIGASGNNILLDDGTTVEEKIKNIEARINSLDGGEGSSEDLTTIKTEIEKIKQALNGKAPINHAEATTKDKAHYGVADRNTFGHVKLTDDADLKDIEDCAISVKGLWNYRVQLQKIVNDINSKVKKIDFLTKAESQSINIKVGSKNTGNAKVQRIGNLAILSFYFSNFEADIKTYTDFIPINSVNTYLRVYTPSSDGQGTLRVELQGGTIIFTGTKGKNYHGELVYICNEEKGSVTIDV